MDVIAIPPDNRECPRCDGHGHEELADGTRDDDPCHVCAGTGIRPQRMLSPAGSARLWAQARTLTDIGRLTARWLDGELPDCLTQDCPPDEETGDIPPGVLAGLNRAGYVTECSQPGYDWTDGCLPGVQWRQRAAVALLMDTPHLDALLASVEDDEALIVTFHKALPFGWMARTWRGFYRHQIPVTETRGDHPDVGEECWFGRPQSRSAWRWTGRQIGSRAAGRALASAWQVTVVDPAWGRPDYLWDTLRALTATPTHETI